MTPPPDFSWWNVLPTLVGGFISTFTTIIMFGRSQSVDRKKRLVERFKEEAIAAFVGFWKLKNVAETLGNLRRQISDAFDAAKTSELTHLEPCDIIKGFVGASSQLEFLTPQELLFLNRANRSDMMAEVDLIVRRAMNIEETMRVYGQLRADMQHFLENTADEVNFPTSTSGGFSMSGKSAAVARLKKNAMNDLLGQMQIFLERDSPTAKILCKGYLRIAQEHFGKEFPSFQLDWVEN